MTEVKTLIVYFTEGNENGEPVIAERQIRIMDKPLGQRDYDDGMSYIFMASVRSLWYM